MVSDDTEHALIMRFYDASASFCNGFECGMIWEMMERGVQTIERAIHSENVGQICETARINGYDISIVKTGVEGWHDMAATRRQPAGGYGRFTVINGGLERIDHAE